ncbi:hypothetical protein [Pseudorhodoferax sp. Leaf267]|uniref:hypothetical protein n=1 Tax=Pseudorhodoferax sp. Leaf267 TaxID=1736316 RepID=UPI0006FDF992|nr:hypothetical protein [Pseudorhodoferax sp. Leaf267]KQP22894.1 hypothetical protein ASF43_03105 [Pseudorhodoferax sp. Leaf267]
MYSNTHPTGTGAAAARARELSAKQVCSVPGCGGKTSGFRKLCGHHYDMHKRRGHALAPKTDPKAWALERAEVLALFADNQNHPGILSGVSFINGLYVQHKGGTNKPGLDYEVCRLADAGVAAITVLAEVAAVALYISRKATRLPTVDSENHLISQAVLRLAPRPRNMSASALRTSKRGYPTRPSVAALNSLGATIRNTLSGLLAAIAVAATDKAEAEAKRRQATYEAHRAPFVITGAASPVSH